MTSIRSYLQRLIGKTKFITIVSGLPRSGTSMMMSALQAGGMPLLVDGVRSADENNPKGYFEYERVKKLPAGDTSWLERAQGKAVKVVSALLQFLPQEHQYRVIFMERAMDEILASQSRMLVRNGKEQTNPVEDEELLVSYQSHLDNIKRFLGESGSMKTLYVSYNDILCCPVDLFSIIADFLNGSVNPQAMASVVDPNLYREKK